MLYRSGRISFGDIWTDDPGMRECLRHARLAATVDICVLLLGGPGTGKNLVAQAIHNKGERATGPFVPVNVAALSQGVLSSELFGSVEGGFSGAVDRPGYFERAHGGTLFLDEIGTLDLECQAKILSVIEDKRLARVGETEPREADFRLIAATNTDIQAAVAEGRFRQDLYDRIAHMVIKLPPLRDRSADVEMLAGRFLELEKSGSGLET